MSYQLTNAKVWKNNSWSEKTHILNGFTIQDLGYIHPQATSVDSITLRLNNQGTIYGAVVINGTQHAFTRTNTGVVTDLHSLFFPNTQSAVRHMNDHGDMVISSGSGINAGKGSVYLREANGNITNLGLFNSNDENSTINNLWITNDKTVFCTINKSGVNGNAFMRTPDGAITDFGQFGVGTNYFPNIYAVNNNKTIGISCLKTDYTEIFVLLRTFSGQITTIGSSWGLDGSFASINGINDSNEITGVYKKTGTAYYSTIFRDSQGNVTDLSILNFAFSPGITSSTLSGINSSGTIAGIIGAASTGGGNGTAFIRYKDGTVVNFGNLGGAKNVNYFPPVFNAYVNDSNMVAVTVLQSSSIFKVILITPDCS